MAADIALSKSISGEDKARVVAALRAHFNTQAGATDDAVLAAWEGHVWGQLRGIVSEYERRTAAEAEAGKVEEIDL